MGIKFIIAHKALRTVPGPQYILKKAGFLLDSAVMFK